jgi:excisionase family DNA binding protein
MTYVETQAYDIRSFCTAHHISRSYVYLEIKAGRLKRFKVGRKTLISREAAEMWRRAFERLSA